MTWTLRPRQHVVVDNDFAGDPDGLAALAHHALSPADDVVAVTGSFTSPLFGDPTGSAARGAELAAELLGMLGTLGTGATGGTSDGAAVPAAGGADAAFTGTRRDSPAARALVDAARGRDIVLVCGGPLTNVADALLIDPSLADRIRLAWVGGTRQGEGAEYNRDTDPAAAQFVLSHPGLAVERFPAEIYRSAAVSVAELEVGLTAAGDVGAWLWSRYRELPLPPDVDVDPVWPLGDSVPLAVTALPHAGVQFVPEGGRRRVCTGLDARLIIGDFFARLALHARGAGEQAAPRAAPGAGTR